MSFYWVTGLTAASPTASFDAIELVEPGTGAIKIWRFKLWQTTDLQDAAEEVLRVEWIRAYTTSGSGGQTTVITPCNSSDAASTVTAELLNTTLATAGSPLSLDPMGWNIRIPMDVLYPPEQVLWARNGERYVLRVSAPADALTCNASCLIEQL